MDTLNRISGADIVRKNSCFTDYLDIMALALANADIPLDEKSSLDFLAQNGYIERRRLNTINEVIRKAEKMKLLSTNYIKIQIK